MFSVSVSRNRSTPAAFCAGASFSMMLMAGFWAGGLIKNTSHPAWLKICTATHESMFQMRRYSIEYFEKTGRSLEVKESIAVAKSRWAIFVFLFSGAVSPIDGCSHYTMVPPKKE